MSVTAFDPIYGLVLLAAAFFAFSAYQSGKSIAGAHLHVLNELARIEMQQPAWDQALEAYRTAIDSQRDATKKDKAAARAERQRADDLRKRYEPSNGAEAPSMFQVER